MDSTAWDDRYAGSELVWSAGPNATIGALVESRPPGRALDLAAGEGRNALWLAQRGWDVTAVDFSAVAIERTNRLADERLGAGRHRLRTVVADVLRWEAPPAAYDLVLVVFLQLIAPDLTVAHRRAAAALAPGGLLVVLAHDRSNLDGGYGGPQDRAVLPTPPGATSTSRYGRAAATPASGPETPTSTSPTATAPASACPANARASARAASSPPPVRLLPLVPGQYVARSTTSGWPAVTLVWNVAFASPGTAFAYTVARACAGTSTVSSPSAPPSS